MACCVAVALVIGLLRTAWHRGIHGSPPPRTGLPPQARRAARTIADRVNDGAAAPAPQRDAIETTRTSVRLSLPPSSPHATRTSPPLAAACFGAATGVVLYTGAAQLAREASMAAVSVSTETWRARDLLVVSLAAAFIVAGACATLRGPRGDVLNRRWPLPLAAGGGAWFLLSVSDMHVFGFGPTGGDRMQAAHSHMIGDMDTGAGLSHLVFAILLHGPGLVALVTAAVGAGRRPVLIR